MSEQTTGEVSQENTSASPASFSQVHACELDRIKEQRNTRGYHSNNYTGLAFSGGGIRSASFSIGVLQAIHAAGKLKNIDYLSTVSGGGYTGSALTWFSHLHSAQKPMPFAFGAKGLGARSGDTQKGQSLLDYIRQHGNYLKPGSGLGTASLIASILRSIALSFAVYFSLLVYVFYWLVEKGWLARETTGISFHWSNSVILKLTALALILFALTSLLYAIATPLTRVLPGYLSACVYRARVLTQCLLGSLLAIAVFSLLIGMTPWAYSQLGFALASLTSGGALGLGAITGVREFLSRQSGSPPASGLAATIKIIIIAFLLIYGLIVGAYALEESLRQCQLIEAYASYLLAFGLFFGLLTNLNYFGIGRMYRDRLAETFTPNKKTYESGKWATATEADTCKLSKLCSKNEPGPYHLINTNVVLVDADNAKFRGRGGDSFLLSPLYCGSDSVRWHKTEGFLSNGMTLPTAMAISGAAANPNAGVSGQGPTRNRLVSFLMSFLGIRLGYWAKNPAAGSIKKSVLKFFTPNYLYPGIVQGLFGQRLNTRAGYLELTDGGHFENLGLYELARRKLDVIILVDAGCDENFKMQDLANAVERVRVDFGYYVEFDDKEYGLSDILPGSSELDDEFAKKYNLAKRGFALGRIRYTDQSEGKIIYLKTTLTQELTADIYGYKATYPDFPDQPTSDQFFDEVQLEAYRELGYQLTKKMLMDTQHKPWLQA